MEQFKLIPIFLVYFLSVNFQCGETIPTFSGNQVEPTTTEQNYFTVENIFHQKPNIKTGDVMECEVTKINSLESNNHDDHVFTQVGKDLLGYVFYPVSKDKKCFSFQVRTQKFPHIILSTTPRAVQGQRLEVIFDYNGNSVIRTKDGNHVNSVPTPGIVTGSELRGFWIRWLDDQFLEVGRDTDNYPILSYRLPEKLFINFIGILSYTVEAEWILHKEPKCGQFSVTEKRTQTETKCKILDSGNLDKSNVLQNLQQHILNQIKTQREIFKLSKYQSKEILLEYQQLIRKHFRNAEENQNKIYATNGNYSPLKGNTFNEITKEYFQFLGELQNELSVFNTTLSTSDEKAISFSINLPTRNV